LDVELFALGESVSSLGDADSVDWELTRGTTHSSAESVSSRALHASLVLDFGTGSDGDGVLRFAGD